MRSISREVTKKRAQLFHAVCGAQLDEPTSGPPFAPTFFDVAQRQASLAHARRAEYGNQSVTTTK
jgi:hypothetical protein